MFSKFSIFTKFLILASALSAILAVVFVLASNIYIKNSFINRSESAIASAISFESRDLQPKDFSLKDPDHARAVFNSLYERVKSAEIIRIKVWDYSGKVIFSNDESIVGQRFPDNDEFKEALKGEVVTEIGEKEKAENISERGYEQLLEVYVPITFKGESVPSGVIEAYFILDDVNIRIKETQLILIVTIVTFTIVSFGLLFMVFRLVIYKQMEQMNLQAAALNAAENGVVITDLKGVIQYVNPSFTKLTGYTFDEALGQSTRILNSGKQDKLFYKNLWDTILEGKVWHGEMIGRHKDGSLYPEEQIITSVKDEKGRITHFVSIKQDISLRKKTEEVIEVRTKKLEDLTKSQEETKKAMLNVMEDLDAAKNIIQIEKAKDEAILQNIGEGVIAVDSQRKVLFLNKTGEEIMSLKEQDLIGRVFIAFPLVDESGNLIPVEQLPISVAIRTGKTTTTTTYFVRPDKTKFPISITAVPVKLNEKVTGAIAVFRDITEEKEIDKAKTEFVSLASHQLRTPLTAINWYIEMLQDKDTGVLNDKQKEYFLEIYKGSQRMALLLNDLLNVSRLETGRLKIEPVPTDLKTFIQEICKEVKPLVSEMGCHLALKLPEELPKVNVDSVLLRQVISNLLTNAIQYSSVKKAGQVIVSLTVSPKEYVISVEDNGIGIPKEVQGRIFEKFFRADSAQEVVTDGNGLGLYLVKQIIETSGCGIRFDSEVGKGSTFYVTIPVSGMKSKEGQKGLER